MEIKKVLKCLWHVYKVFISDLSLRKKTDEKVFLHILNSK